MPGESANDAARDRLVTALAGCAINDRAALRQVYDLTQAKLFGICLRISQDREAAEDILQNVYLKVWDRAGAFDATRASPITWLATIARNTAIDWRRRFASGPVTTSVDEAADIPDDIALPADEAIDQARVAGRIRGCLDGLEPRQRNVIQAAFWGGHSYPELAAAGKVPLGTVKSWVRRGLLRLKACLGDG